MIVLKHIKMENSKKDGINHFGTTISHTLLHRICNFGRGSTQIKKTDVSRRPPTGKYKPVVLCILCVGASNHT